MNVGDYVLFRQFQADGEVAYRIGRIVTAESCRQRDGRSSDHAGPPDTDLYVQELHSNEYWISFNKKSNGTYELLGHRIIPAPDQLLADALLLSLAGEIYNIPASVGAKLVEEYYIAKGLV